MATCIRANERVETYAQLEALRDVQDGRFATLCKARLTRHDGQETNADFAKNSPPSSADLSAA